MRSESKYIIVALIILVAAITGSFFVGKKFAAIAPCPPEGQSLVDSGYLDSLLAVATTAPDTVFDTTIIVKKVPVRVTKKNPFFINLPGGQKEYSDTLKMIDEGINAWVKIKSECAINEIIWGYTPVYKQITQTINQPAPYPVEKITKIPQKGLWLQSGVGYGQGVGFSVGLMWQTKKGLSYGAEMVQFDKRYYMAKVAYKIL